MTGRLPMVGWFNTVVASSGLAYSKNNVPYLAHSYRALNPLMSRGIRDGIVTEICQEFAHNLA